MTYLITFYFQVLSGHLQCVMALKWGGEGLIYSASQDRSIKVWRGSDVSCLDCVVHHRKVI